MPAEPLFDFETTDLGTVLHEIDDIRRICKQRGQFEMLDGILHTDHEKELVVGFKEIRASDWWVPFHIPGRPVFPGALMIEAVAQLATYHFIRHRPDLEGAFVGFGGLNNTRFRGTVEPDCRLLLAGRCKRIRKTMFIYDTQAFVERDLVFETELMGVVV